MKKFNELVDVNVTQAVQDDRNIRKTIARIMPPESLAHLQFCRVENRVLKITLDNASWLARLRFVSSQIIGELKKDNITVSQITWHVAPEKLRVEPRPKAQRLRARSQSSANIVQATAETMEDDELKRALLKVAEQLAKRPDIKVQKNTK